MLSPRKIHSKWPARSIRPPAQTLTEATMKAPRTSQGGGRGSLDTHLSASVTAAQVMGPAAQVRVARRHAIRHLIGRREVRLSIYSVAGRLNVDAQSVHESAGLHEKRLACLRVCSPSSPGGSLIGSSAARAGRGSSSTGCGGKTHGSQRRACTAASTSPLQSSSP